MKSSSIHNYCMILEQRDIGLCNSHTVTHLAYYNRVYLLILLNTNKGYRQNIFYI